MSTFHGLEMAKQALFTQQSALYTTGHNIANANTEGYSRQRVNFEAETAFPAGARNRPEIAGQIGTGVKAGSVQRIRNEFLDLQFRSENSLSGYWNKGAESLGRMESLMNELNETGLSKTMDDFWDSLQDLSVNPINSGARSVVVQRGIALADTFNYYNSSLTQIRADLKKEIDVTIQDTNTILNHINNLNEEIKKLEVHGYVTNDLYDKRDVLIDNLSQIIDIEVDYSKGKDHIPDTSDTKGLAQGLVTIKTGGNVLVDGVEGEFNKIAIVPDIEDENFNYVSAIKIGEGENTVIEMPPSQHGTLQALIVSYGYQDGTNTESNEAIVKGDFIEMLNTLDAMANTFAEEFNSEHNKGFDLNGNNGVDFFSFNGGVESAGTIRVNQNFIDEPDLIAASNNRDTSGSGSNALNLAKVLDNEYTFEANGKTEEASIKNYYSSVIGSLGVRVQEAERMSTNTSVLLSQVEGQRQSVTSVSLDEEMTNMIKFQHAYNAAARSMTATDELIDRIINNMGLVGR